MASISLDALKELFAEFRAPLVDKMILVSPGVHAAIATKFPQLDVRPFEGLAGKGEGWVVDKPKLPAFLPMPDIAPPASEFTVSHMPYTMTNAEMRRSMLRIFDYGYTAPPKRKKPYKRRSRSPVATAARVARKAQRKARRANR